MSAAARMAEAVFFKRLDNNPIPENGAAEIRATIVTRNEVLRLPFLLNYYRQLGVTRFFVTDNNSDDASLAFLLQQKDCHVFSTNEAYAGSGYGVRWHQHMLDQYGESHWWLMLDADEMLVYPDCENTRLPDFCRQLDAQGAEGLYTLFLDMYGEGRLEDAVYRPGQNFLDICPYFDRDYVFRPRAVLPFAMPPFPAMEPIGGPRLRLFYSEFYKATAFKLIAAKLLRKIRDALHLKFDCAVPPMLFKIPLFKNRAGLRIVSSHATSPIVLAQQTGALLHFKFFSDFHEKVVREVKRGQHYDGASEYARYLKAITTHPGMVFRNDKSLKYIDSAQLATLGLIRK